MRVAARMAALLAGVWAGVLVCIAALAAPSAFAVLARPDAGRFVGRLFEQEAYLSLATAVVLLLLERARRGDPEAGASVFGAELMLLLGTLFCTVAGHFAVLPMMDAARAGHGSLSFGALHGISAGFFALKGVLVLALAWRLAARAAPISRRSST
ncbi:MAG TPA: DUF4149 domain-containing protein [Burkholderiaceae bacterium]